MAAAAAARAVRTESASSSSTLSLLVLSKRVLSSPSQPRLLFARRALFQLSRTLRLLPHPSAGASRCTPIRCCGTGSGDSHTWLNSGSDFRGLPSTKMAPLFSGCDYKHWIVLTKKPGVNKFQMIRTYVGLLSEVVGSKLIALTKIYKVSHESYFGFGCEIDEEAANKLKALRMVLAVIPDPEYSYRRGDVSGNLSRLKDQLNQLAANVEQLKNVTPRNSARHFENSTWWYFHSARDL